MAELYKIVRKKTEKELIIEFISIFKKLTSRKKRLKKRFSLVLPGGSSPINLYEALSKEKINWSNVDFFWVDERFVSRNSIHSNFQLIKKKLLNKISIKIKNLFPIETKNKDIHKSSNDYEKKIKRYFKDKKVSFDLILLGMGLDGHIASLFPNSIHLKNKKIITTVKNKNFDRITLSLKTINTAKRIFLWLNSKKKSNYYRKFKNKKRLPVNKLNSKRMHLFILN